MDEFVNLFISHFQPAHFLYTYVYQGIEFNVEEVVNLLVSHFQTACSADTYQGIEFNVHQFANLCVYCSQISHFLTAASIKDQILTKYFRNAFPSLLLLSYFS